MSDFNLQEDLLALTSDASAYTIPNELDIPSLPEAEVDLHLSSAIESVTGDPDSLLHSSPTTFDIFRSILKHAGSPQVSGQVMTKLLDAITSGLEHHVRMVQTIVASQGFGEDMDAPMVHKAPLEVWAFLLQWFVLVADKSNGRSSEAAPARGRGDKPKKQTANATRSVFIWYDHIPTVLATSQRALKLPTSRIWRTTSERESFVSCFVKPAYQLCETEVNLKSAEIRTGIYRVICLAVKFNGHAFGAQTSIIQNLTYFEHLSEPMAELLEMLEKEFDYGQLGEEVLREVAAKTFAHNDAKGPRSFSKFLVRLAEGSSHTVQKQMPLLLAHLESEAHPMRMALIEIIGIIIRDISNSDDGDEEQKKKQIKRFFELLMERYLDLNSWVRCKVLQTIIKLCELPNKFPKQRAAITELTISTLQDKTSSARRYAIQLLSKLLETHPFGALHGGTLNLPEWQERFDAVSAELAKVDAIELEKAKRDVGYVSDEEAGEGEGEKAEDGEEQEEEGEDEDKHMEGEDEDKHMEGDQDGDAEEGDPDGTPRPKKTKSRSKAKPRQSQLDVASLEAEQSSLNPELVQRLRLTKKYYADALKFINQLEKAIPQLCILLVSTTKSEVLESMKFFRTAYEYNIQGAEVGIKRMLHLIWTKDNNAPVVTGAASGATGAGVGAGAGQGGASGIADKDGGAPPQEREQVDERSVKGQVIETYKSLYFDAVEGLSGKQQVSRIAKNMIERTYHATLAELTSLEELMRTMMADNGVHPEVVTKLWQVYGTEQVIPKPQRQGAIIILGMLALARREVVTEKVDSLLKIGLGQNGMNDLILARYTCIALQRLGGSAKKVKGSLADRTMRLPMDNPIFIKLQEMIEHAPKSPYWFGMAEQAINTIYLLGEQPDALCSDMLKHLTAKVFASPTSTTADQAGTDGEAASDLPSTPIKAKSAIPDTPFTVGAFEPEPTPMPAGRKSSDTPDLGTQMSLGSQARDDSETPAPSASLEQANRHDTASAFQLAQLVFAVGHVAVKHIVYLELVEREFKRRKDANAKEKAAAKAADKDGNDLDAVAGNAEDDIGDLIANIREKELLYGENSLLKVYGPMVASICASPKRYKSAILRQAATLALTKLMCVSAQFCEQHLLLLFRILESSRDPVVRSNIVIALGDIAVCFGSLIDDNSERLYQGLSDPDPLVKKNTLMVLTHLILNGMIKVKGQLGEMAKCLEDADPRISDLAKLFFTELSTKDNALYNNLQDVISHLSVGKHKVGEEEFERVMRFIFTFIEKDKQAESIVEKLCQRFRTTEDERQWRDLAFCLSLLPFKSERSMKRLIEGLPMYQDKLHEEVVYKRFTEILAKARANKSSNKPETELNEFEAILAQNRGAGLEEQALEAEVARKTKAAKRRAAKRNDTQAAAAPAGRRSGRSARTREEEDEDEDEGEEEEQEMVEPDRPKRGRRQPEPEPEDEDEEEEEEERDDAPAPPRRGRGKKAPPPVAKKAAAPARRGRKAKVVESDEEEDDE